MPDNASMCSQSRVRDGAQEEKMAHAEMEERRDLAEVTSQIAALNEMTTGELAERFRELYGVPTRSRNKRYLQKRLAWKIQELAHGGLSQRALDRIEQLAPLAPIRWRQPVENVEVAAKVDTSPKPTTGRDPRLPEPGSTISRKYKGVEHQVIVHEADFEFAGKRYRSLSKVARQITGTNWNGYGFFKLGGAA